MRKGQIRRDQFLSVSERLFLTRGYQATSLQDILDEVGCTKGSFYHHFDSKFEVLDEIALQRAQRAFADYQAAAPEANDIARLDALLYHALPLRQAERDFVAVVLALNQTPEGTLIINRLLVSRRQLFLPELERVLEALREQDLVGSASMQVIALVWEAFMAFSTNALAQGVNAPDTLLSSLRAARFMWERVLDVPYGSLHILPYEELMSVLTYASDKAAASATA
ncbi:MAG: TetR/AcrR family transcriptional regulator [Christensenellales bacterium]